MNVKVNHAELYKIFNDILLKNNFPKENAEICAEIFAENTLVGVHSHGVNRFSGFIKFVQNGNINPNAEMIKENSFNALEQWNADYGAGPINALTMTKRVMELSDEFGIGCVSLRNSNHWMRPGYYAWYAADKGYVFLCGTNTIPIMPPWQGKKPTTGNNPIVFGVPHKDGNVVLDMALSQYSYGKLESYARENKKLEFEGGFDAKGNLSKNPNEILESVRPLPIGLWKGAGLSLILDLIATILSGGNSTYDLSKKSEDSGMSQIFIAINPNKFFSKDIIEKSIEEILNFYLSSETSNNCKVSYPGQRVAKRREENLKNGIEINKDIWEEVLKLKI